MPDKNAYEGLAAAGRAVAVAEKLTDALERISAILADEVNDSAKVNRIRGVLVSLEDPTSREEHHA